MLYIDMTLELIMSLESSLVWTTSNNKSQIIFVILKISLCKVIAISSHWWLQQWPVRLRCSASLQLINCLDVWLMKGKWIHLPIHPQKDLAEMENDCYLIYRVCQKFYHFNLKKSCCLALLFYKICLTLFSIIFFTFFF